MQALREFYAGATCG